MASEVELGSVQIPYPSEQWLILKKIAEKPSFPLQQTGCGLIQCYALIENYRAYLKRSDRRPLNNGGIDFTDSSFAD